MLKALKSKIKDHQNAIISVGSIAIIVTLTIVVVRNAKKEIAILPSIDEINEKLANGTASIIENADGSINVFW